MCKTCERHNPEVYTGLCQSGLMEDFASHSSLAVLLGAGSGWLRERTLISCSDSLQCLIALTF
jgi:hypothetical protein